MDSIWLKLHILSIMLWESVFFYAFIHFLSWWRRSSLVIGEMHFSYLASDDVRGRGVPHYCRKEEWLQVPHQVTTDTTLACRSMGMSILLSMWCPLSSHGGNFVYHWMVVNVLNLYFALLMWLQPGGGQACHPIRKSRLPTWSPLTPMGRASLPFIGDESASFHSVFAGRHMGAATLFSVVFAYSSDYYLKVFCFARKPFSLPLTTENRLSLEIFFLLFFFCLCLLVFLSC